MPRLADMSKVVFPVEISQFATLGHSLQQEYAYKLFMTYRCPVFGHKLTTTGTLNEREDFCPHRDLRLPCNKKFINWHFENLLNDKRSGARGTVCECHGPPITSSRNVENAGSNLHK